MCHKPQIVQYSTAAYQTHISILYFWNRGAEKATRLGLYGFGNGNFLLDEVNCTGIERTLEDCDKNPWKDHDCSKFEVAGVVCYPSKGNVLTYCLLYTDCPSEMCL